MSGVTPGSLSAHPQPARRVSHAVAARILADREILVVANTGTAPFAGNVVVDRDLNPASQSIRVAHSNLGTTGTSRVKVLPTATFHSDGRMSTGPTAAVPVTLAAGEVQILAPG